MVGEVTGSVLAIFSSFFYFLSVLLSDSLAVHSNICCSFVYVCGMYVLYDVCL